MPVVSFVHPKLRPFLKQYELISDCLAGEMQVKFRRERYLPRPNPEDLTVANNLRYDQYILRAVFYNVAQRTLQGLVGQVFLRDPAVTVPPALQPCVDDATGEGVPLAQLSQEAASFAMSRGRCGLFIDYPDTAEEGGASAADIANGNVRATFKVIDPKDILNWRVKKRGAKIVLSMVVFREDYIAKDDGFETVIRDQYRVLSLDDNDNYTIDVYQNNNVGSGKADIHYVPKDHNGNTFDEIAFKFVGAITNDANVDLPPMYDICSLNIAHYRNSADYEESVYIVGQPTPWASGLTEEWVKDVMGGKLALGARGIIPLPTGGAFGIEQVEPNTIAKEAMEQKEAQMLALGAKLVEGSQVVRTATEAEIDNTSETSVLSSVAKNVANAFGWALEYAAKFMGEDDGNIDYTMNTEFDLVSLTAPERAQLLKEWQSGAITWEEYRDSLRRAGIATMDDAKAKAMIAEEDAARLASAVATASAMAIANPADPTGGGGAGAPTPSPAPGGPKPSPTGNA